MDKNTNKLEPKKVQQKQKFTYALGDVTSFIKEDIKSQGYKVTSAKWNEGNTSLEIEAVKDDTSASAKKPEQKSKKETSSEAKS